MQSQDVTYQKTRPVRRAAPKASRAGVSIFARLARQTKFADPALLENWPSIAGAEIAGLCRPGRITGHASARTLEVYAPSGSAAAQVQMLSGGVKERVNRYLGPGAIARITIVQAARPAPVTSEDKPLGAALASFRDAIKRRNGEK